MSERVSSGSRSSARLGERRRKRRRRLFFALIFLLLILCGAALYGLQQTAVRIAQVEVYGADASLAAIAREALQGSYLGIIPRDSIFFYPEESIRANILRADSDISTLSIFRKGLTGLTVKVNNRVPIARWCGAAYVPRVGTSSPEATCYVFDDTGFLFATTTALPLVHALDFYEEAGTSAVTIGTRIPHTAEFPAAFNFARELATLGSPVEAVAIHGNEVDNHLASGTRVTYVLGHEQEAFTALVSAKGNINLADGSLEYVDLRFSGKMYFKKKDGSVKK